MKYLLQTSYLLYFFLMICSAEAVKIREVEEADLPRIHKSLQDSRVTLQTARIPYPITIQDVNAWYESNKAKISQGTLHPFAITPDETNKIIGVIELKRENPSSNSGELGYWLKHKYWGKGYMTGAIRSVAHFGFNTLSLDVMEAHCLENNLGSIRALQKNSFEEVGRTSYLMPVRNRVGTFVILRLSRMAYTLLRSI